MVRLVAVAIDQDNVTRPDQGMDGTILFRRGCAIGDEEAVVASKRACRRGLREF
jgi:hypothetical protein